jgi:hypothetical protein
MPNKNGNAYGLTALCPIKNGSVDNQSFAALTRQHLQNLPRDENSPMALVPNTYLCRFYILNDVFFEGGPPKSTILQTLLTGFRSLAREEHLKSKYLVFSSNFHGDLDDYLRGMWNSADSQVREIWKHCVTFDKVDSPAGFVDYIKRCQVENALFFNGSTDDSLAEQLKSLYLKQEFSRFVFDNQGSSAQNLQAAFNAFVDRTQPTELKSPTWKPGAAQETVV